MSRKVSYACPVCNGFSKLSYFCSRCHQPLTDGGRLFDYFLDYSPYRPIDDAKMTDGLLDYTNHTCPHVLHCPHCDYQQTVMVKEIQT